MKRTISVFALILTSVFVLLSVLGRNSEYNAERSLYRAMEKLNTIKKNPDVVPPGIIASAEREFKNVLTKYPNSRTARLAFSKLTELYGKEKKYDDAISISNGFIEKHPDDLAMISKAIFTKALCYEKMDSWDKALAELNILRTKYVNTPLGLQTPFYIANHYRRLNDRSKADTAVDEAIAFYTNIKTTHAGTTLGYAALDLLIQVYIYNDNFTKAGNMVEEALADYSSGITSMQQVPYIDLIFIKKLKQPDKAINLLDGMLQQANNPKVKEYLEAMIKRVKDLKQKNYEKPIKNGE